MKHEFNENAWPCHVPERSPDDSLLQFDFGEIAGRIKHEDAWTKGDRNAITLLKSPFLRILLIALKPYAKINFHYSGNLLTLQLLEGAANLTMGSKTVVF